MSRPAGAARSVDAVTLLTVYLVLVVAIPSTLKISPLRGLGSPAVLMGLGMAAVWLYWQFQRTAPTKAGAQPVRTAFFVVVTCIGLSFVAAMVRPIDQVETNASMLGAIGAASWGGVLLLANDGVSNRERSLMLLRRVVLAGACLAVVGLLQFVTGQKFVDQITLPGFTNAETDAFIGTRSGFNRPSGTALHAIEFGYAITMILPLALNLAIVDRTRSVLRRAVPVGLLVLAVVTSISRSAIICGVLAVIVAAAVWPAPLRRRALLTTPFVALGVFITIPGLLGSVLGLFTGITQDTSALSRTSSYEIALDFFWRNPVIGRGFGTFTPAYRILDNAYLLLLIEVGVVGLTSVLALIVTAMWCARRVRAGGRSEDILLGQALLAALVSCAVGLAFFDGLSFPMASGLLFLMLGITGAHWRIVRREQRAGRDVDDPRRPLKR